MSDPDDLTDLHSEGFYWVVLGQSPPEIACWVGGKWWLAGEAKPWHPRRTSLSRRSPGKGLESSGLNLRPARRSGVVD
jgi:hypothetical protein